MGSLGAAISGSVESLCLPCRRLMNSKSPRPLGGTYEDNCSSIQQPHFQCVFKVRMQHLRRHCAVLQLSSMESRPPDADNLSRGNIGAVEELQALFLQPSLLQFMYADLGDHRHVNEFFSLNAIDAVMHFATVAYVSEVWLNHYGTFAIL